jgi:hypothetical protein
MVKHRKFNVDRFLDKFAGQEPLLAAYAAKWKDRLQAQPADSTVDGFKRFLAVGDGDAKYELVEGLYRAYDLCTDRGHEDLAASCRGCGYEPDPDGKLPVECLSLKVLTENEDAFNLAYDRNRLWQADRFTVYRGTPNTPIKNVEAAIGKFKAKLAQDFTEEKSSNRVLVRHYQEGPYTNLIVYHEKRTKAELTFKSEGTQLKVSPTIFRPAQQDFISYNHETGQVEVEARFEKEESSLRRAFAGCCLNDEEFFEAPEAAKRIDLSVIAKDDFSMTVEEGHEAALVAIRFWLPKTTGKPSFDVRSKDVLGTLKKMRLHGRLKAATIEKATFKITFPDDGRGKRVEVAGTNSVAFRRMTHAEEVFRYLKNWGILLG